MTCTIYFATHVPRMTEKMIKEKRERTKKYENKLCIMRGMTARVLCQICLLLHTLQSVYLWPNLSDWIFWCCFSIGVIAANYCWHHIILKSSSVQPKSKWQNLLSMRRYFCDNQPRFKYAAHRRRSSACCYFSRTFLLSLVVCLPFCRIRLHICADSMHDLGALASSRRTFGFHF